MCMSMLVICDTYVKQIDKLFFGLDWFGGVFPLLKNLNYKMTRIHPARLLKQTLVLIIPL